MAFLREFISLEAMSKAVEDQGDNDYIWNLGLDRRNEYVELCRKIMAPFVNVKKAMNRIKKAA